jgi:transposase
MGLFDQTPHTGIGTMTLSPFVVGCDVSKTRIDFFDLSARRSFRIANTTEALNGFLADYAGRPVRFAFEATGFYGHALRRALARHGFVGVQINPLHGRRFAQASGRLAKTDRIDAQQLALMTMRLDLAGTDVWQPDIENLKALIARRSQLTQMLGDERRRLTQTDPGPLADSITGHLDHLRQQIDAVDQLIHKQIEQNSQLRKRFALLQSIPGIGPKIATLLIALMPEIGKADRRAIAALAGIAPVARDSGMFSAKRSIAGGRKAVRQALYIAALAATRGNSRFNQTYKTLIQAGKPSKVALIAVARKILITANAILKTKTPFNDQ